MWYFNVLVLSTKLTYNWLVHSLYALRSGPSSLVATDITHFFFITEILFLPTRSISPSWKGSYIICLTAIALEFLVQKCFHNRGGRFLGKYLVYSIIDFICFSISVLGEYLVPSIIDFHVFFNICSWKISCILHHRFSSVFQYLFLENILYPP